MPTKTLYFDESGFTGYNLLDETQPFFVISSTDIEPSEAEEILKRAFPSYRGEEFKFSNIWKTRAKADLVTLAKNAPALKGRAFSWMTDKRFAVLGKMVDFLIEPWTTKQGYDFYADGFCWKYANYIHHGLTTLAPQELYDSLVEVYQAFSRDPSDDTLAALQFRLAVMVASHDDGPVKMTLEQMSIGANAFERFHDLSTFGGSIDLHVTTMLALVCHWRRHHADDFSAIHDKSAHFFRHRETWELITSPEAPPGLHTGGDGVDVEFPLRVVSTEAVDSKDNYSVQLCDVLAGLKAKIFDKRIVGDDRELLNQVIRAGASELQYNGVRPTGVFPAFPPRQLNGPDAVDKMREVLFPEGRPRPKPGKGRDTN
jgi:hypothetical protein